MITVQIRRGKLINTDPQRRCYNGCYFSSHIEWNDWEDWMDYPDINSAKKALRLFARDTQQLRIKPE